MPSTSDFRDITGHNRKGLNLVEDVEATVENIAWIVTWRFSRVHECSFSLWGRIDKCFYRMGALRTDMETTKTHRVVISVHKDEPEIENRFQKRSQIEKRSDLSGRDRMIIMPSLIILDNQLEVSNSDKLRDIRNTVRGLHTKIICISDNIVGYENSLISRSIPSRGCINQTRRNLLVLDINGLLADIVSPPPKNYKADKNITRRAIFKRPFCRDFMEFCFEKFDVAIWSSRTKVNVKAVTDYLLGDMKRKLVFCWDLSQCTPSKFRTLENRHKTLVFKELRKIWEKCDYDLPWEKGYYNETNTLLLDDSPYKALLNPPNTAVFPYSFRYCDENDNSLGTNGDLRIFLEDLSKAENVRDYVEQHPFGQFTITETDPSWDFYIEAVASVPPR